MQEAPVWPLSQEDPLEKEMATPSSILAWRIPWTEEQGRLQATGSERVRLDLATTQQLLNTLRPHAGEMRSRCSSWEPQPAKIPADKQDLPWSSYWHPTNFTWLEPKPAWLQPSKTQRATAQQSPPDLLTHRMVSELKWLLHTTRFGVTCYVSTMSEHRGWGDWVFLSFAYCCFKQGLCACNYLKWGHTGPGMGTKSRDWCFYNKSTWRRKQTGVMRLQARER